MVNCPFCNRSLDTKLAANFYFCKECEVAVRSESDMPCQGLNIYDQNWVRAEANKKINFTRASYIVKQLKKLSGVNTVLDIGCGTGVLVDLLNQNGYIADGIDTSPDAIEFAKSHRKGNFYVASIERYENKYKYDVVIASHLIEHLRNPEAFLSSVKQLLKPSGYLYIETPNLYSWKPKSIWRRRLGGMIYGTDHRICYTRRSLSNLLQNSGFDIYKVFTKTYSPTILDEIVFTLYHFLTKNRKVGTQGKNGQNTALPTNTKRLFHSICSTIYRRAKDSFLAHALLLIPNEISQVNDRGHHLIAIATNPGEGQGRANHP